MGASFRGPHEYLGSERPRLPIRRGHEIGELGLADISALQERRVGDAGNSPLKNKISRVSLDPTHMGPEAYFGIRISPGIYRAMERVLDADDDRLFVTLECETRGEQDHIHEPLAFRETQLHGYYLADRQEPPGARTENMSLHKMQFDSDGDITSRFGLRDGIKVVDQYLGILATGYYMAQNVFRYLGLTSQARVEFRANLLSLAAKEGVANAYQDYLTVDLARDRFADAFTSLMMRMYRTVNRPTKRDAVRNELQHYADLYRQNRTPRPKCPPTSRRGPRT